MAVRHYKLALTTVGPVHVGNGSDYGKKDYFKLDDRSVGVLDAKRFVAELSPEELDAYCRFLDTDSSGSLQDFLFRHQNLRAHAQRCLIYRAEMSLTKARRGSVQYLNVAQCIKDAYGRPYVPGSSVKGMLRTALLTHIIVHNPSRYAALYDSAAACGADRKKACRAIERQAFWQEHPDATDPSVVNDIMRYVSVSDSAPLSTDALVFAKKYDKFSKADSGRHKLAMGRISQENRFQEGNELNIYRECIRPGTSIELTIDVDERIDAYLDGLTLDAKGMALVLKESFDLYTRCFLDKFDLAGVAGVDAGGADDGICRYVIAGGPLKGRRCRNRAVAGTGYCNMHKEYAASASETLTCHFGGGVDFDLKTVINALFEDDATRIGEISHVLYEQFPTKLDPSLHGELEREVRRAVFEPRYLRAQYRRGDGKLLKGKDDHRHWKDVQLGVSPHTVKLGIIGSKKYLMGKCSLTIEEVR